LHIGDYFISFLAIILSMFIHISSNKICFNFLQFLFALKAGRRDMKVELKFSIAAGTFTLTFVL
jgi:hypothetical protein